MAVGASRPWPLDYALLVLAVANISSASILVRLAGVHGFAAATWRLALSAALTWLLLAARGGGVRRPTARDAALMAASGVALALHLSLWMVSLFHLSVAASVTIVDTYPALLALLGWLLYGEKPGRLQLAGAALTMLGVAMLARASGETAPPGGDPVYGALLAFAGMLAVAAYFTIGKGLRSRYDALEYTGPVYTVAAAFNAAASKAIGVELSGYEPETYLYLLLLAVLPMLGGHTVINHLLGRMSLVAATVPVLGEPVGASILAWLILGEPVSLAEAVGMAVTITGIALVLLGEGRRPAG